MNFNKLVFIFVLLFSFFLKSIALIANERICFSENKGQWDSKILAKAKISGGEVYVTNNKLRYIFSNPKNIHNHSPKKEKRNFLPMAFAFSVEATYENKVGTFYANKYFETKDYENYFIGNEPSKWKSNVKKFSKLFLIDNKFPVSIELEGKENSIKSTYFLKANSDLKKFNLQYSSDVKLTIVKNVLSIKTPFNEILEFEPIAFQFINGKKKELKCLYQLVENNKISFSIPQGYDPNYELEIDPTLVFCSYSGSLSDNFGMTATYDINGNAYTAGPVFGLSFPTTDGAYDSTAAADVGYYKPEVGILKFRPDGQDLIYCTFIGGNLSEVIHSMVTDDQENLYVFGSTGSADFPITSNAYQSQFLGGPSIFPSSSAVRYDNGCDGYISKFNPNGTQLLASTYFGGGNNDAINMATGSLFRNYGDEFRGEINLDEQNNVYVFTTTNSTDIQTSANAFQTSNLGEQDALIIKLNTNLSSMLYCSYLGGTLNDCGNAIYVSGNKIILGGGTNSTDFPATSNAYKTSYQGGICDGFIAVLDLAFPSNNAISYFGTSDFDEVYFVQSDFYGRIYGYGQSSGPLQAFNCNYFNANAGQFICCLNSNLSQLKFNSLIGNSATHKINISPGAFLVDNCNRIFISGWGGDLIPNSSMNGMPITSDAIKSTTDSCDFYLAVLDTGASAIIYASYFGGATGRDHVDGGTSRFDKKGIVYQAVCAGCGISNDFPTTPNAYAQTDLGPNCNNGMFKIDFKIPAVIANFSATDTIGCAPFTTILNNTSIQYEKFKWIFPNGQIDSVSISPSYQFLNPGTYTIKLIAQSNLRCTNEVNDSIVKTFIVNPKPVANFNYLINECFGSTNFTDSSYVLGNNNLTYSWNFGDGNSSSEQNPIHQFNAMGNYTVSLIVETPNSCKDTLVSNINIVPFSNFSISPIAKLCHPKKSTQLNATGGVIYKWEPAYLLDNPNIANPIATTDSSKTFIVHIYSIAQTGDTCIKTLSTEVQVSNLKSEDLILTIDQDTVISGQQVSLNANILGEEREWTPKEMMSNAGSISTNATVKESTLINYTVKDSLGCVASDTIRVFAIAKGCPEPLVFVPNTFTPNADGKNDFFIPKGDLLISYTMQIFDRWGNEVYFGNETTLGWNGKVKEKYAEPGAYAYVIKGKCYSGDDFYKQGNVTLLK